MQHVGRYRLTRKLGQGGMAEVYEAVAEGEGGFRRRVAIKRVLPQLSRDLSIARMFLDEARTTGHLHHGNIVSVLDYGHADGSAFQVLEFVDGLDLDGLLRRADERSTPLPLGLALYIVLQVAHALDYAHNAKDESGAALGIVHRDVSPSNVLISWDGHVKLSDFGIALATNRLERTVGAGVKGKLEYMSPEQAVRGHIDRRSDVFALGCMLHRLITGKSPLAELSALTQMAAGAELSLDPALEPCLHEVIARATRHTQAQRYASAEELSRALAALLPRFLSDEPTFALQRWLAALNEQAQPKKKRGALDALLNVELVLSVTGDGSDALHERSFVSRTPVLNAPVELMPSDQSPDAVPPEQAAAVTHAKPKALLLWRLATILLFVGAAGAIGFYATRDPDMSRMNRAPAPAPVVAALPAVAPSGTQVLNTPKSEANAEPVPAETAAQPVHGSRLKPLRARERSVPSPELRSAAPVTAPVGRGTLVIGGDRALRAEIRIDGNSVGYAPKRVELSEGSHEVVLLRPDGTRIGPQQVRIETHHTQSAPAKWIVD